MRDGTEKHRELCQPTLHSCFQYAKDPKQKGKDGKVSTAICYGEILRLTKDTEGCEHKSLSGIDTEVIKSPKHFHWSANVYLFSLSLVNIVAGNN